MPTASPRSPAPLLMIVVLAAATLASASGCRKRSAPEQKRDGGAGPAGGTLRVTRLIRRLQSPDEAVRRRALAEVQGARGARKPRFSAAEGIELIRAATMSFPDGGAGPLDTPTALLAVLADEARLEYQSVVAEVFPRLAPLAKDYALLLLAGIEDGGAAESFMRLLDEHAAELTLRPLNQLREHPHHPDAFFPKLLDLARNPVLADEVYLTALTFCEKGLLPAGKLEGHTAALLEAYRAERRWLGSRQGGKGNAWMWDDDYQAHRHTAGLLLDLFGYLPLEYVEVELVSALAYRDPRLVHFAAVSLVRQGRAVPARALDVVAASAEMRNWLYEKLKDAGRLDLFPSRFLTQQAFAESAMVQWLVYPTELGSAPDQIELKKVVGIDTDSPDGILDYYVFRFRTLAPHWAAKDGWMAGIAGPFLRKDAPSPVAYGGTFSRFESWSAKTPEAHLGDTRELLQEWADRRKNDETEADQ
jgi:hypothetical protein